MFLFFNKLFSWHTCMHPQKTFVDHAIGTIYLYNKCVLCTIKRAPCDMWIELCYMKTALCLWGVCYVIWVRYVTWLRFGNCCKIVDFFKRNTSCTQNCSTFHYSYCHYIRIIKGLGLSFSDLTMQLKTKHWPNFLFILPNILKK